MREIRSILSEFDLSDFIGEIFNFLSRKEMPFTLVACFSESGVVEELDAGTITADSVKELLFRGKILFLPFSDINTGDPVPCADGNHYLLSTPNDLDEEVAISAEPVELIGFLLKIEQEKVIIEAATFSGGEYYPVEGVEMEEDWKELSEPMSLFVERFMHN